MRNISVSEREDVETALASAAFTAEKSPARAVFAASSDSRRLRILNHARPSERDRARGRMHVRASTRARQHGAEGTRVEK